MIKWSEPREAVETIATFGIEERGEPLELDGASADLLCDGVAELLAENVRLRTERDAARTEMLEKNSAAADALNHLWKEIVLSKYPDYGEWDYPNQAARFIKEEYNKLCAKLAVIEINWGGAPEWAEWLATDSDYTGMWYENKPRPGGKFWEDESDGRQQYARYPNWRNSLERRPEETENAQ